MGLESVAIWDKALVLGFFQESQKKYRVLEKIKR